jgi:dTDP-glucose 4,6-dehydratase
LRKVLADGRPGRTYNVGGGCEKTNLEVVRSLCGHLDDIQPDPEGPYERLIQFVADRPGHDYRYAINSNRMARELGWRPTETFESGLKKTVRWYLDNSQWVDRVKTGAYRQWMKTNYEGRNELRGPVN